MSQIELRELLEVIKTTKDEMALEGFIVDITGKVVQNIEEEVFCMAVTFFLSSAVANLSG
jgi:hypothetical protein